MKMGYRNSATHNVTGETILIKRGENGYYQTADQRPADDLNAKIGVTKNEAEAMFVGSMFGWNVPGARPEIYDENGRPKELKKKHTAAREASYAEGMRDEHY